MKHRKELEEILAVLSDQNYTVPEMVEYILSKNKEIVLTQNTIRKNLYQIKRENTKVLTVDSKPLWKVINNSYVFEINGNKKVFSIEFIDNIFLFYSRKGYNFTRIKCQNRFDLNPGNFRDIQETFNLSKDSDTISPHTKSSSTKEELEEILDTQISKVLNSGEMTTDRYNEAVLRKYRKVIDQSNLHSSWKNEIISEVIAEYPNLSKINILRDDNFECEEISVVIGDLHAGGESDHTRLSNKWNTEMLFEKLSRVAEITNSYKANKVNLLILGDLVETISGINHPDSWKNIEKGMFGANVIIQTKEILVTGLLNKIANLKTILATGGNHDRLQHSNKLSDTGATDLVFHMIEERLKLSNSGVTLKYDPVIFSHDTPKYGIIGVHGDKGLHKRELSFLINSFAINKNKYQFVVSAHLHSFICKPNDDENNGRRITIPAIMTGNPYSDIEIGRSAPSGFVVIKNNIFNSQDLVVHNI